MVWSSTLKWLIQHLDDANANLVELAKTINEQTISQITSNGNNVLHFAALCRSPSIVLFMAKVAPLFLLNAQNYEGETPFHWGCRSGNLDIIKAFLICGADSKATDFQNNTSLHFAIEAGNETVVKFLVQNRCCHLETRNNRGLSPLASACEEYEFPIIRFLLRQGASPTSLLQFYSKQNKQYLVKFLNKHSKKETQTAVAVHQSPISPLPTRSRQPALELLVQETL